MVGIDIRTPRRERPGAFITKRRRRIFWAIAAAGIFCVLIAIGCIVRLLMTSSTTASDMPPRVAVPKSRESALQLIRHDAGLPDILDRVRRGDRMVISFELSGLALHPRQDVNPHAGGLKWKPDEFVDCNVSRRDEQLGRGGVAEVEFTVVAPEDAASRVLKSHGVSRADHAVVDASGVMSAFEGIFALIRANRFDGMVGLGSLRMGRFLTFGPPPGGNEPHLHIDLRTSELVAGTAGEAVPIAKAVPAAARCWAALSEKEIVGQGSLHRFVTPFRVDHVRLR